MNGITVTLKDRTKTASCRETVALCAKYALTVSPALEVDETQTENVDGILTSTVKGYLVLHRRFVGRTPPDGAVRFIAGQRVADQNYQWDTNEVYGYSELTTRKVNNVWVTTGELDLRTETLCRDFVQTFGANANAPLKFAVYDPLAGGLVGEGEFDVKVVEPYYISQDQSLTLFKGDKGDNGITPTIGANGHWYFGDTDTGVQAIGQNGTTPIIGLNGHWFIGEFDTNIVARGRNGNDGSVCTIGDDGYWYIDGVNTNVKAQGKNGSVCTIDPTTKHWLINGVDTGVLAEGVRGETVVLDGSYVFNEATNKWHKMKVFTDPDTGEKTVFVEENGVAERPEIEKPTCTVSKSGNTTTVVCKDHNGTTTAEIKDGEKGDAGPAFAYAVVDSVPATPAANTMYFVKSS